MWNIDYQKIKDLLLIQGTNLGLRILGALVLWIVGLFVIRFIVKITERALRHQAVDSTIIRYLGSTISVLLKIILLIAILGFFGVQTATFAALIAAAGLAIGVAWSGLLANFAAGTFLIIFRPFKVGDFVSAGGAIGTVEEVGLFATTINTPDNIKTIVGNNKIFADNIQNFSATPYRRVDLDAPLHHSVNPMDAIQLLRTKVATIPNVLSEPAPVVEILQLSREGTRLAIRPFCKNENYWQVYFDTNRAVREALNEAGFPPPVMLPSFKEGTV
jgi:small conductance mechanosensitive channel